MEADSAAAPSPARPNWPWITLIVLQALQLCTLLPWLMVAGFAVMAFDAPDSTKHWQPWAFVLTIWSYPIWLLAAGIGSWILFVFRHYKSAVALAVLLILPIPVFFLVIFLINL